jgi:hypothetical protein
VTSARNDGTSLIVVPPDGTNEPADIAHEVAQGAPRQ